MFVYIFIRLVISAIYFFFFFFFFKQKTAYEIGLGIPAEPLFRSNVTLIILTLSLDTLKVKIISVTFRRVIRTNHKKASKIWRHENIQLGGRSEERRVGKECIAGVATHDEIKSHNKYAPYLALVQS